jgi:hypothetical protein
MESSKAVAMKNPITCPALKEVPGLVTQLDGTTATLPDAERLRGAPPQPMRDLGLPGNEYAQMLRVQELDSPDPRVAVFQLQVDDGSYGSQWTVTMAVCNCEGGQHVAHSEFVHSSEQLPTPS